MKFMREVGAMTRGGLRLVLLITLQGFEFCGLTPLGEELLWTVFFQLKISCKMEEKDKNSPKKKNRDFIAFEMHIKRFLDFYSMSFPTLILILIIIISFIEKKNEC